MHVSWQLLLPGYGQLRAAVDTTLEEHAGEHEAGRRTLIERYLSVWHRDRAGDGCPVSGFAADLGREPGQAARSRDVYITGIRNRAARLATGNDDGMAQLCTMVGALVLARATRGNPISEELLQAARTGPADGVAQHLDPAARGRLRSAGPTVPARAELRGVARASRCRAC